MNRQQAIDLDNNMLWKELVKEIDQMVVMETTKLLSANPEEVTKLQERVKAYMALTRLPQQIAEREEE